MLDYLVGIMRNVVVADWLKTYYETIEIPLKIPVQGYSVAWLVDSIRLSDDAFDCFGIEHSEYLVCGFLSFSLDSHH